MLIVIFDWIRYVLVDGDTPWYYQDYEHLLCGAQKTTWTNKWTNAHGHRCLHCALQSTYTIFTYLTDWITSYGHESIDFKEKLLLLLLQKKSECNCLTFNCNRLLYAWHGNRNSHRCAHWFCCLIQNILSFAIAGEMWKCGICTEWANAANSYRQSYGTLYVWILWIIFALIGRTTHTIKIDISSRVCLRVCAMHHTIDWQSMCVLIFQHNR